MCQMVSTPHFCVEAVSSGSFWAQGRQAEAHSEHRGGNREPPMAWVQLLGPTGRSPCLVDLPQQLLFWCIALCSCFTAGQWCGSVGTKVCPVSALNVQSCADPAGPATTFPWPSCMSPRAPCPQWPLSLHSLHTCPPASACPHPGELSPAHLAIANQRWPGQPRERPPSSRLPPAASLWDGASPPRLSFIGSSPSAVKYPSAFSVHLIVMLLS